MAIALTTLADSRPSLPTATTWRRKKWSELELLDTCAAHRAPRSPGIVLLFSNDKSKAALVWAGVTANIQERLDEMLRCPQDDPVLEDVLAPYPRDVSFRYLVVPSARRRTRLLKSMIAGSNPTRAAGDGAARP